MNFRTGKGIPKKYKSDNGKGGKKAKQGRPLDTAKNSAFMKVVQYLEENDDEQTTVADLTKVMGEYLEGTGRYGAMYMKDKLKHHFGDKIVITTTKNKANVVTFKQTASSLINEFYCQPRIENSDDEKRIIEVAARLIKSDIESVDVSSDVYPNGAEMSSVDESLQFVPALLHSFVKTLSAEKDVNLKITSVGQEVMQSVRPRVLIAPLQLGLGVQMHHSFSSKFLIDSLNSHGFSVPYKTCKNYERSAAVSQETDIPGYTPGQFVQYSADNVDHNSRTLDGTGTFHGMGIIASITPGTRATVVISKRKVTEEEIAKVGRIVIRQYIGTIEDTPLHYEVLRDLQVKDSTANLNILWKLTHPILQSPRPGWSGMMQLVCSGACPGKSSVHFLPMIDLDP